MWYGNGYLNSPWWPWLLQDGGPDFDWYIPKDREQGGKPMETMETKKTTESAEATETMKRTESPQATETTKTTQTAEMPKSKQTTETPLLSRKNILIRFLFTLLVVVAFWVFESILLVLVLFQYIYLMITRNHSEGLRTFCNKIAAYAYNAFRYISLNENARPFPFAGFPQEMDPPEPEVSFD
jgi:hypothetical protein